MPSIVFVPVLYVALMYIFLGIFGVIGLLLGLAHSYMSRETVLTTSTAPPKIKKTSRSRSESPPKPRHRYNLRSRRRTGPKHRPAFGGLMEI